MEMELIELKDVKPIADIIHPYPERIKYECIPLVIDNGKSLCKIYKYFNYVILAMTN